MFLEGTDVGLSYFDWRMREGLIAVFLAVLGNGRDEEVAH